jgi:hypothetical protein
MSTPSLGYPTSVRLSRSPIFITGKNDTLANDALNAMTLEVSTYTGAKTSPPASPDYTLEKTYSVNEIINFEISDLIRDEFLHPMGLASISTPTASEVGEVLWVVPEGEWTYENAGASPVTATWGSGTTYGFLVLDGWSKRGEAQNRQYQDARLTLSRTHQVYSSYRESLAALYAAFSGLNGLLYVIDGTNYWYDLEDKLGFSNTSNESQNKVIYIPSGVPNIADFVGVTPTGAYEISLLTNNEGVDYRQRVLDDGGTLESWACLMNAIDALGGHDKVTHDYEVICEPKYTPEIIQYVNRYGVSDYITFFKRSNESGNFKNDSYQKSVYADAFTEPDFNDGKYQDFNINSRNTITLNTGWVEEAYKDIIEELMMSEKVAILEGGNYRAVNPQRGSVDYLKSVNEKMINYTVSFDYGFDERNLVR